MIDESLKFLESNKTLRTRLSLGAKVTALYVRIWNVAPAVFVSTITDFSLVGDTVLGHREEVEKWQHNS